MLSVRSVMPVVLLACLGAAGGGCIEGHGDVGGNFTATDIWFSEGERFVGVSGYAYAAAGDRWSDPKYEATAAWVELTTGEVTIEQEFRSKKGGLEPSEHDYTISYFSGEFSDASSGSRLTVGSRDGRTEVELVPAADGFGDIDDLDYGLLFSVIHDDSPLALVFLGHKAQDCSDQLQF